MISMSTVSLDNIQTGVTTSLILLAVILTILVFSIIIRLVLFFLLQKKGLDKPCQNCECKKQAPVVLQPQFVPVVSEDKLTTSSSPRSKKKSSQKDKKRDEGKKKTAAKTGARSDVDLEKGENTAERSPVAKKYFHQTMSGRVQQTTSSGEQHVSEEHRAIASQMDTAVAASPAPGPLLTGETPLGEAPPLLAAAVDSLIISSALKPVPVDDVVHTSLVHTAKEAVSHPAAPSISVASTFDGRKNTAV